MENKESKKLGLNFKSFRETRGFSQEKVSDLLGVSRSYVSNLENGKINPTLSTITKLAAVVGVSVGELTTGKNELEINKFAFPTKIELLINEIKSVGQDMRDFFIKNEVIYFKEKVNRSDIITDIDLRSEKILTKAIRRYFPEIKIISEESFAGKTFNVYKDKNIAVIDPLDGTANFFTNIPYFCLSVFLSSSGDGAFGLIYDPITDILLVGGLNRLEFRQDDVVTVAYPKNKTLSKKIVSVKDMTCAVISNYNIPPSVTQPFIHYLYSRGVKRVLSHWSPSHDYMNLIMNKYDCVISLSEPSFSEAAGLFFVEQSANHILNMVNKKILGKEYFMSVSSDKSSAKLITNLVKNYKAV